MKTKLILIIGLISLVFAMMFAVATSRDAVAGVVGLWLLDDGKGDVAKDSSGRGHDGEITGCEWVDGKFDKGLRFESGNYMEVPHHDDFNLTNNLTIELWANIEDLPLGHVGIPGKGHDQPTGSFVFHPTKLDGNNFELRFYISIGDAWPGISSAPIPFGEWHHLAGTHDGSETKVYVDGELAVSEAQEGNINITDTPLKFANDFGGRMLVGILDEIRFSNVVLTEADFERSMDGVAVNAVKSSGKLATVWGKLKS